MIKKLVRIITIYNEEFFCILYDRTPFLVITSKGSIPLDEIKFIDYIGDVV